MKIKRLGISPDVSTGVRTWRVIWRPFLDQPIYYTDHEGKGDLKRKSDNVKTKRFPITGSTTEKQAFEQAKQLACSAYRVEPDVEMPTVDWEALAKEQGAVLRNSYAKPGLNDDTVIAALRLYDEGFNDRQVAEQIGVNRTTVMRWKKKHLED